MTKTKTTERQIVIAWTVTESVYDGKPYARDLGARPGFRLEVQGRAAMWLRRGTAADVAKAKAYAETETAKNTDTARGPVQVFTFPTSEAEPLEAARRAVVAAAKKIDRA